MPDTPTIPAPMPFGRQLVLFALLAAAYFAAVFPTLRWVQFSGDSEDNVVETVLEMRRGGPWWVPTLGGEPRLRKPPLAVWITAAAVSPATVAALDSNDQPTREAAYASLAVQMRWPSLLAGALLLIGAGLFGRIILGSTGGFLSLLIAASTLLTLRFTRVATTDVWLAVWVTFTNVGLAAAMLQRRRWLGFCTAGAALGLALMTKGPVAPIQTILPAAVYAIAQHQIARRRPAADPSAATSGLWAPLVVGLLVALTIALPWWIDTFLRHPEFSDTLKKEFAGDRGATRPDPFLTYLVLLPLHALPWLPLFVAGIYVACQLAWRERTLLFTLCLMVVPLIVMSFHGDRKDRYLLPLTAPLATLTAVAALEIMKSTRARDLGEQIVRVTHWVLLVVFAAGIPIAGATLLKRLDATPWLSLRTATLFAGGGAVILGAGAAIYRKYPAALVVTAAAVMLWINVPFLRGWSASAAGLSEMRPIAEQIRIQLPRGDILFFDPQADKPITMDLDIYLNHPVHAVRTVPLDASGIVGMVVLRRPGTPEPSFPGWAVAFDTVSLKHHYHFYVMVPRR